MKNKKRIICSLWDQEVQEIAQEVLGRKLTNSEIDKVQTRLNINWEKVVENTLTSANFPL
jgi:hypothetical protein